MDSRQVENDVDSMESQPIEVTAFKAGERLDKLLVDRFPDLSRVRIQALIKDGQVTVDGKVVKPGIKLRGGEQVLMTLPDDVPETPIAAESIPLNVVYEDDDLAVIEKPAGMVVHPAAGNETGTLVNALLARWPQIANIDDPDNRMGIVHRLDKDTSGLIVIAKTIDVLHDLMAQFQERTVEKTYLALVEQRPQTDTGRIDAPIGRDPKRRKQMAVMREGRPAVTEFTVIDDDFSEGQALLRVTIQTGRTHQIRVHLAFIGCPVVGDRVYGRRKQRIRMKRNFLHATYLCFDHPRTDERLCFDSDLPIGLQEIMRKLRKQ